MMILGMIVIFVPVLVFVLWIFINNPGELVPWFRPFGNTFGLTDREIAIWIAVDYYIIGAILPLIVGYLLYPLAQSYMKSQ